MYFPSVTPTFLFTPFPVPSVSLVTATGVPVGIPRVRKTLGVDITVIVDLTTLRFTGKSIPYKPTDKGLTNYTPQTKVSFTTLRSIDIMSNDTSNCMQFSNLNKIRDMQCQFSFQLLSVARVTDSPVKPFLHRQRSRNSNGSYMQSALGSQICSVRQSTWVQLNPSPR